MALPPSREHQVVVAIYERRSQGVGAGFARPRERRALPYQKHQGGWLEPVSYQRNSQAASSEEPIPDVRDFQLYLRARAVAHELRRRGQLTGSTADTEPGARHHFDLPHQRHGGRRRFHLDSERVELHLRFHGPLGQHQQEHVLREQHAIDRFHHRRRYCQRRNGGGDCVQSRAGWRNLEQRELHHQCR